VPGQPNEFVVGVNLSTNGWLVWRRTVRVDAAGERVTTDSQPVWVAGSIASLV
jgi:hypothetical protein